jgi:hypothetical protein
LFNTETDWKITRRYFYRLALKEQKILTFKIKNVIIIIVKKNKNSISLISGETEAKHGKNC